LSFVARTPSAPPGRAPFSALLLLAAGFLFPAGPALAARTPSPCGPEPVHHRLARGETLYRVSVKYGVAVDEIVSANRIRNPKKVAAGTLLLVPCASGGGGTRGEVLRASLPIADADFVEAVEPDPGTDLDEIAAASEREAALPGAPELMEGPGGPASLTWPISPVLSSPFGPRHGRQHAGVDLRAPEGTPVHTAGAGVVADVRKHSRGYGTVVTVNHAGGLLSLYAHLEHADVEPGQQLAPGDLIGRVGQTGNATAPHLHFEIRREGRAENPLPWLPAINGGGGSEPDLPARAGAEDVAAH
jgi:murein DD-endopeptidase MepM/ murein hydrolase activator NlpD